MDEAFKRLSKALLNPVPESEVLTTNVSILEDVELRVVALRSEAVSRLAKIEDVATAIP